MRLQYIINTIGLFQSNFSSQLEFQDELLSYSNIMTLAKMSYNAYESPGKNWEYVPGYNHSIIGNVPTVEGYIFTNGDTTIISIKGTSVWWYPNKTDSEDNDHNPFSTKNVKNDRFNDNLFLSCCYYRQSNLYKSLCNATNTTFHICEKQCYSKSTEYTFNYMTIAKNLIDSLIKNKIINQNNSLVFTGHSLGGFIATYLGVIYQKPVITFEAPGEKYYFDLIGLDYSRATNIYHFGHTADPVFTGRCNGPGSICWLGGYIIRTKCHIGNTCTYDSISKLKFTESIFNHRLKFIINNIIPHWEFDQPTCSPQINCKDCEQWTFI